MRKKHNIFLVLMVALFLCFICNDLFAADEVALEQKNYSFHTALQSPIKEILEARIQEAFRRLGLHAELLMNPSSQRALMLANTDGDGDAARVPHIKDIAKKNTTNLIQVPESIVTMELTVYSKDLSFPVAGWSSLEKYHNGARVGAKILEKNIPGKRTFLPTTVQLVQMLNSGRIDTMVEWNLIADNAIQTLNVTNVKKLSPAIKIQPFHIYLHKKHQALVPELSEVLRQMKEDGSFEKVSKEFVFYTGADSPEREVLENRLHEAFKRIGIGRFKLVYTGSAQRALVLANEDGDGDANRVATIKQIAPEVTGNLIQIPESINVLKMYVYSKGGVTSIDGYKSLGNLRNGFRVGTKILEKNIPGERIALPDATRLFQMLNDGRLDTVVEWSSIADKIIEDNRYSGIIRLPKPLIDLPTYSFIHQKHRDLVPEIARALKEMKQDGTFEKIKVDTLERLTLN